MWSRHRAVELDVPVQIELVSHEIEMALVFRQTRKMLAPVPLLENLIGKGVGVGIALRVETVAGIAVSVPSTANAATGLDDDWVMGDAGHFDFVRNEPLSKIGRRAGQNRHANNLSCPRKRLCEKPKIEAGAY